MGKNGMEWGGMWDRRKGRNRNEREREMKMTKRGQFLPNMQILNGLNIFDFCRGE
jgi:hypothetical protein